MLLQVARWLLQRKLNKKRDGGESCRCHRKTPAKELMQLQTWMLRLKQKLQEPETEHDITVNDDSDDSSIDEDILYDEEPSSGGKEVFLEICY